jgi:hypothetical protein
MSSCSTEYDTLQSWWLTYYTDWTFTLFGLLAIVGVGSTAHALLTAGKAEVQVAAAPTSTAHDASSMAGTPPDTPKFVETGGDIGGRKAVTWRWWEVFHQLLFTVVAPSELFLTVYYWITIGIVRVSINDYAVRMCGLDITVMKRLLMRVSCDTCVCRRHQPAGR